MYRPLLLRFEERIRPTGACSNWRQRFRAYNRLVGSSRRMRSNAGLLIRNFFRADRRSANVPRGFTEIDSKTKLRFNDTKRGPQMSDVMGALFAQSRGQIAATGLQPCPRLSQNLC